MTGTPEPAGPAVVTVREHDGAVLRVTLDAPRRRNAMNARSCALLREAIATATEDPACRVLVLDATGPAFCAGWDLADIAEKRERGDAQAIADEFAENQRLLHDLAASPLLTVAAVQGPAMGFGISLVVRCDVAIASASATFALPEIVHGIVPAMVALDLSDAVGPRVAREWLLTGSVRTADEAAAAGLVSRVVADDALVTTVDELAATVAAHRADAVRATKRLCRELETLPREAAEQHAIDAAVRALAGI
ncbi:MAG: enoyl-CoA hydratase/isomerase family protein [Patulibacter sp.]|nr:enoyl-CoA hydratase/isomerase family protein [Patulibacter sp.]